MKFVQVLREENEHADRLVKARLVKAALAEHMLIPSQVLSFVQISLVINSINVQEIGPRSYWTKPIISYLKDDELPDRKEAARKLKVQAACYVLIKGILYKRGFSQPYLRCLIPDEADYVMQEVHV